MECGAKRRNGEPCKAPAMKNGRCRIHGGKTPSGIASPNYQTGQYSKHLPTRLAATYKETLEDKKLWELNEKAALVNTRIVELIGKLDTGEAGATWKLMREVYKDLMTAVNGGKSSDVIKGLAIMGNLIEAGNRDYLAWAEITEQIETYRKLSESERKHQDQMERMISADQVMVMISAITDVIRQNVSDRQALYSISQGITKLISIDAGG